MQSKADAELLKETADRSSEAAFGEIVRRYTNLVYSAALREADSPAAALKFRRAFSSISRARRKIWRRDFPLRRCWQDGCAAARAIRRSIPDATNTGARARKTRHGTTSTHVRNGARLGISTAQRKTPRLLKWLAKMTERARLLALTSKLGSQFYF